MRCFIPLLTSLAVASISMVPGTAEAKGNTVNHYGSIFFSSKNRPGGGDPQGCLVGSMGRQAGKPPMSLDLHLHPEGYKTISPHSAISVTWQNGGWLGKRAEFSEDGELRDTFRICLRPGKYFLYSLAIGEGGGSMVPTTTLHVPITVEAGKTRYIGSFVALVPGQADDCGGDTSKHRVIARDRSDFDRLHLAAGEDSTGESFVVELPDYSVLRPIVYMCSSP